MRVVFKEFENSEEVRSLFEKADHDFMLYLGYDNIDSAIEEIMNADDKHNHWGIYLNDNIIGLMYIYDYRKSYQKCSLGYGLLPDFRGKNLSLSIVNKFCEYLENEMNIIRIQIDVELTNKNCINFVDRNLSDIGFEYECTARNYWGNGISCNIYSRCIK